MVRVNQYLMGKGILIRKGICLIFALVSMLGSVLYLFYFKEPLLWNLIGLFLLITDVLLMGILQAIAQRLGRKLTKRVLIFYGSLILKYGILFLVNFIGYGYQPLVNVLLGILIYGSVWAIQLMGIMFIFQGYSLLESQETHPIDSDIPNDIPKLPKKRIIILSIIAVIAVIGLYVGIIMDTAILTPMDQSQGSFAAGIIAGMMGIFLGVVNLAFTGILMLSISLLWSHFGEKWKQDQKENQKQKQKQKRILHQKKVYVLGIIAVLGLLISSISFLPLLSTPSFSQQAEEEFSRAFDPTFGGDW